MTKSPPTIKGKIFRDFEMKWLGIQSQGQFKLPGQVGVVRVDGASHDFSAQFPELLNSVVEGQDLGRADEGEGQRVEEEDLGVRVTKLFIFVADVAKKISLVFVPCNAFQLKEQRGLETKTTVLSCHTSLINTGVETMNYI
jgi:hypothetical protein